MKTDIPLDTLFKRLHLANARRVWRDLCDRAEKEEWAYDHFLGVLVAEEVAHRQQTRLQKVSRAAGFPFLKTVDDFNFTYQSTVRLPVIGSFLSADFVTEGRSLILHGKPGRGKTHLAIAIAYRAIQNGFDAHFVTAAALIEELSVASKQGKLREAVAAYTHPHVLVVDEIGYLAYGDDAANVLYHVVNQRHLKKRSMIFTTNKPTDTWGQVLHDADLGDAIVDRILERGRILKLDGPSIRTKHLGLDDPAESASTQPARVSGIRRQEFPEPTPGRETHPVELKLRVVREIVDEGAPGAEVARVFGIPGTTISEWVRRYRAGGLDALVPKPAVAPAREAKPDPKREAVAALKREHPEFGTRRIRDVLKRFEALGVSESVVRRILHEEGLLEAPAQAGPREHPERRFERAQPNELWQSDLFTFLLRRHERLYLVAFMDDHSRFIVGHAIAHHQRSTLVLEALDRAIAAYGTPREILTDQGRQYTAWRGTTEFEGELRRQGIRHVKSRPQHPQTLGKIERFWKTLWDEFLSRTVFADFADCCRRIALFIDGYNFQRPHQALEGLVPADRFFRSAPEVRAAVERSVQANALRMAQEKPPQKPFYLVGRLGDRDLSIAAGVDGLRVRVGTEEQTIRMPKESGDEGDERTGRGEGEADAETPGTPPAEVAEGVAGPGRDGAPAVPAGAVGAVRGEAGDGGDRGDGDVAGRVLPAGGEGAGRVARGVGADTARAKGGPVGGDRIAGSEGGEDGGGEAAGGAAAASDAEGGEGGGSAAPRSPRRRAPRSASARL